MFDRVALKAEARERMRTAQPGVFGAALLVTALSYAVNLPYLWFALRDENSLPAIFLNILSTLLAWVLGAGLAVFLLAVHRRQDASYNMLMDGFGMAGKVIWLQIRMGIQVGLWSMLFLVPGIIAAYRYSFALYCLIDDPDLSAGGAIRRSCELTGGRKWDLFVLDLSFLGWSLLIWLGGTVVGTGIAMAAPGLFLPGLFTRGVVENVFPLTVVMMVLLLAPLCWLKPYMTLSVIGFYRKTAPDSPAEAGPSGGAMPWEG